MRWHLLPDDLQELIVRHAAAMRLQCACRRRRAIARFRYARDPVWETVRTQLGWQTWSCLVAYSHVRHEWRTELTSWLDMNSRVRDDILAEARRGLWGRRWSTAP